MKNTVFQNSNNTTFWNVILPQLSFRFVLVFNIKPNKIHPVWTYRNYNKIACYCQAFLFCRIHSFIEEAIKDISN